MNKLLTDTCQCGCNPTLPENLLKITSGNDFSIKLQLTEKIDDNWVHYDMTDMSNVIVSVMSPNNTATELDYIIDAAGNIQAIVDAQKFQSYIIYGIEVLWRDATDVVPVDKRAYAPNVFAFVNSSMEATDSSYEYTSDNPYEYNISMSNDVVLLSIGYVPDVDLSDYYTKDEIDSTLENYATDQDVADAISTIDVSNYVTNSSLTTTLQDYVTDSELTTTLNPYATKQYVDDSIADIDIDTSNFYTKSEIDTTLALYGTSLSSPGWLITGSNTDYMLSYQIKLEHNGTELNRVRIPAHTKSKNADDQWFTPFYSALLKNNDYLAFLNGLDTLNEISSNYVTNSSLTTTLQDYAQLSDLSDYVTDTELSTELSPIESNITSLDGRVTTLENNPSVPSNVVTSNDGNEIVCLTQSEYDTLEQNDQLDSDVFYYITDTTSNYVTDLEMTSAINTAIAGVTIDETNLVHKTGTETITGQKTFTDTCTWTGQSMFGNSNITNNSNLMSADIANGLYKTPMMVRPSVLNLITGQIIAPNQQVDYDSANSILNEVNTIKFQKVDSIINPSKPSLSQLAKIDTNGIYEGNTLLANKYVQSTTVRTIVQLSQNDYDDLVNNSSVDPNTMYIIV